MTDLLTSTCRMRRLPRCLRTAFWMECSHSISMYFITVDFISNQSIVIDRDCGFIWWLHSIVLKISVYYS